MFTADPGSQQDLNQAPSLCVYLDPNVPLNPELPACRTVLGTLVLRACALNRLYT